MNAVIPQASMHPKKKQLHHPPGSIGKRVSKMLGFAASSSSSAPQHTSDTALTSASADLVPESSSTNSACSETPEEHLRALKRDADERHHRVLRLEAASTAAAAAAAEAERLAPVEVASAKANRVMALKDGRHISFAEAGDPTGFPVICFFGIGGSRYLVLLLDEVAKSLKLRVISPDRPGFGRSSLHPRRRFSDFAYDVEALCDALNISTFGLWGYSVGCAYAAVCALSPRLRKRIATGLTLVSPWVPLSAPGVPVHFTLAKFFPRFIGELLRPNDIAERRAELKRRGSREKAFAELGDDLAVMSAPSARLSALGLDNSYQKPQPKPIVLDLEGDASPRPSKVPFPLFLCGAVSFSSSSGTDEEEVDEDEGELTDLELRALETLPRGPRVLLASIIEAQRQGARGFAEEFKLCCAEFGFDYARCNWPARIYHGTDDNLVSTQSIRWLVNQLRSSAKSISDVEFFQVLGGTHNGMVFAILKRSLTAIASDVKTDHIRKRGYGPAAGESLDDQEDD